MAISQARLNELWDEATADHDRALKDYLQENETIQQSIVEPDKDHGFSSFANDIYKSAEDLGSEIMDKGLDAINKSTWDYLGPALWKTTKRRAKGFGLGSAGMVKGVGGVMKVIGNAIDPESSRFKEIGEKVTNYARDMEKHYHIKDPNLIDKIMGGYASAASFIIPGLAVGKLSNLAGHAIKIKGFAEALGVGVSSVLEAGIESGGESESALEGGASQEEAQGIAYKSFGYNLALLLGTNKLGGLFKEGKKGFNTVVRGAGGEFVQEGIQEYVSTAVQEQENPFSKETLSRMGEAGIIGAATGGTVGGIQALSDPIGSQKGEVEDEQLQQQRGGEPVIEAQTEREQYDEEDELRQEREQREDDRPEDGPGELRVSEGQDGVREELDVQRETRSEIDPIQEEGVRTEIPTPESVEPLDTLSSAEDLEIDEAIQREEDPERQDIEYEEQSIREIQEEDELSRALEKEDASEYYEDIKNLPEFKSRLQEGAEKAEFDKGTFKNFKDLKIAKRNIGVTHKDFGKDNATFPRTEIKTVKKTIREGIKKFRQGGAYSAIEGDLTKVGGFYFEGGIQDPHKWRRTLIQEFGPDVTPHLKQVFDNVVDKIAPKRKPPTKGPLLGPEPKPAEKLVERPIEKPTVQEPSRETIIPKEDKQANTSKVIGLEPEYGAKHPTHSDVAGTGDAVQRTTRKVEPRVQEKNRPVPTGKPDTAREPVESAKDYFSGEAQVSQSQLPVGEGKKKASRLAERMLEALGGLSEEDRRSLPNFNEMNKRDQIIAAAEYVSTNPDEAILAFEGKIPTPKGLLANSIGLALEQKAVSENDSSMVIEIASLRSTRFGQEIGILTEANKESPVRYISDLLKRKIEAFGGKEKLRNTAQFEKSKLKRTMKKSKISRSDWSSFIKEIEC